MRIKVVIDTTIQLMNLLVKKSSDVINRNKIKNKLINTFYILNIRFNLIFTIRIIFLF